MKNVLLILGILALITGLFWAGQGAGYINWPAYSLMISQKQWIYYGGFLAVVGLFFIWLSRR